VPIGFDVQEMFNLSRNPYDKLGHFFQGLVPALAAREILLRSGYVRGRKMVGFLVCCIALAISAAYELISGGRRWRWARAQMISWGLGRSVGYAVGHVLRLARGMCHGIAAWSLPSAPAVRLL
jgi:hypothetical protein